MTRKGFVLGGNLIVDVVKTIDIYPPEGTLAGILALERGVGGCPTNNAVNLKVLDPDLPVAAVGCVGDDEYGRYVLDTLAHYNVETGGIVISPHQPTSYTDVMTVKGSGTRTFFHDRGANSQWTYELIPFDRYAEYAVAQIGYILLLDGMDAADAEYGTVMARACARFQQMGLKTAVDVVSEQSDRFARIVTPALRYVDYLILNEIEAGHTVDLELRGADGVLQGGRLRDVAERLLQLGNSELVVIHMPEGGYALTRAGEDVKVPSYALPDGVIAGSVGAGDAFCSGVLYGLEKAWLLEESLRLGTMLAACNLFSPTATGGALSLEDARAKMANYALRPLAF